MDHIDQMFSFDDKTLSVSQLTRRIKALLEDNYGRVTVEGELCNVKVAASGHLYGGLKDERALIKIVMFRSSLRRVKFEPEDGQRVVVKGRITVYEARGDYQLLVSSMEPLGTGALMLAFEQMKKKLQQEGLFDAALKKALPPYPTRIGIVTSASGAAIHDIINVTRRRMSSVSLLLYPSLVQGEQAAREIAAGIAYLDSQSDIDVIIVGRGGGSIEDLWPFNEEVVARAIAAAETPIISAVGHETDFTIADFVADVRAPTPSAAAELVVKDRTQLQLRLDNLQVTLRRLLINNIAEKHERLLAIMGRPIFAAPLRFFEQYRFKLDENTMKLSHFIHETLTAAGDRLNHIQQSLQSSNPINNIQAYLASVGNVQQKLNFLCKQKLQRLEGSLSTYTQKLKALSPESHLARGYAMVFNKRGKLIRSIEQLRRDEIIRTTLMDGSIMSEVREIYSDNRESE